MPVYKYRAINESGKSVEGIVDADSPKSAIDKLKRQRVYLSSIEEVREGGRRRLALLGGVSTAELAVTTRQFSTLVSAGLPLEASLATLAEQSDDARLRQVFADLKDRVSGGSSLASAMSNHPSVFSDMYVNMVRAGEASGTLDVVLARLAEFIEKQSSLMGRVRGAVVYPVFMMFVGAGVLFFMMSYVVPKITKMFERSDRALPLLTRMLIAASDFVSQYAWLIVLFGAFFLFALYRFRSRPRGREYFDRVLLRIPTLGRLVRMVIIARFSRTLGTLLATGIPLLEAIDIAAAVVGNSVYTKALARVRDSVREGASLAATLKDAGIFPPLVVRMVAVGEQTGEVEDMLKRIADTYDMQVESALATFTSLLEPLMILALGVVVGFIVFAILLPIFELTSTVGM